MKAAQIVCIGVNHHTAPLAVREALACTPPVVDPALGAACPHLDEWVLLSTCNRVEIYTAVAANAPADAPYDMLLTHFGCAGDDLLPHLYVLRGEEAVAHLLRVASGLDSLVLGEPQILGQVNRAFSTAQEQGTAGPVMRALFRSALATGKRVRSETEIGRNPASVPSVALTQARVTLGSLQQRRFLLIGAGAMAQTAVKALRARSYEHIAIANRTPAHAAALADSWGGAVYTLDELPRALVDADVVFAATHAGRTLLTREMLARVMEERADRPILLFDLSVPRNIEPAAVDLPGVTLIDMDRLQADLDESLITRRGQIPAAAAIVAAEQERLRKRLAELAVRPVITGLRRKAEAIRRREMARTLRHLSDLDEETLAHIDHLTHALVNQLLHEPTQRLRREANGGDKETVSAVVCELFNLTPPHEEPGAP